MVIWAILSLLDGAINSSWPAPILRPKGKGSLPKALPREGSPQALVLRYQLHSLPLVSWGHVGVLCSPTTWTTDPWLVSSWWPFVTTEAPEILTWLGVLRDMVRQQWWGRGSPVLAGQRACLRLARLARAGEPGSYLITSVLMVEKPHVKDLAPCINPLVGAPWTVPPILAWQDF